MPTVFREWMERLNQPRGAEPEWPILIAFALEYAFRREVNRPETYGGDVFIDRDNHLRDRLDYVDRDQVGVEDALTYALYYRCHFGTQWCPSSQGCLSIDGERFWLLGFQWPTGWGESDLVALTQDGGLVVFECKAEKNSYTPIVAVLEGLDYLRSHTAKGNFAKIVTGFRAWKAKLSKENRIPNGFENTEPSLDVPCRIIVLAPRQYYDAYDRSRRSLRGVSGGWGRLAEVISSRGVKLRIGFAFSTLIRTTEASWLKTA